MKTGRTCVFACLILLGSCDEKKQAPKDVFKVSWADAFQRLSEGDLLSLRRDRQCGILIHIKPEVESNRVIHWQVVSSEQKVFAFSAVLTPITASETKIEVVIPPGADGQEPYDGRHVYFRPAMKQPVRPAIEEQFAALLEARAFDPSRVPDKPDDPVCTSQLSRLIEGARFNVYDRPGSEPGRQPL